MGAADTTKTKQRESYEYFKVALHARLAVFAKEKEGPLERWHANKKSPLELLTLAVFLASNALVAQAEQDGDVMAKVNALKLRVELRGYGAEEPWQRGYEYCWRNSLSFSIDYCRSITFQTAWFEFVSKTGMYAGFLAEADPDLREFAGVVMQKLASLSDPAAKDAAYAAWWTNK